MMYRVTVKVSWTVRGKIITKSRFFLVAADGYMEAQRLVSDTLDPDWRSGAFMTEEVSPVMELQPGACPS